jgi:hypothetical protein
MLIRTIFAVALFVLMQAGTSSAQVTWNMATGNPDQNFNTQNIAQFIKDV